MIYDLRNKVTDYKIVVRESRMEGKNVSFSNTRRKFSEDLVNPSIKIDKSLIRKSSSTDV
jgi:hypothetical protein